MVINMPRYFQLFATDPLIGTMPCNYRMQISLADSFTIINVIGFLLMAVIFLTFTIAMSMLSIKQFRVTDSLSKGTSLFNPLPVTSAAVTIGIGLGGFFDGVVFHQILQWHNLVSNSVPQLTPAAHNVNMFWDGMFHFLMLPVTISGVFFLVRLDSRNDVNLTKKLLTGGMLAGWGIFNIVEGTICHYVFQMHNVRENVINSDLYNGVFMLASFLILAAGSYMLRQPKIGKYTHI